MSNDGITQRLSDPYYINLHLSENPQSALNGFDEAIAWLTTPFKRLGISGWTQTGCSAGGLGQVVKQDGVVHSFHSTDGFYTIDVAIVTLALTNGADTVKRLTPGRFIRLEVEPGTRAHAFCDAHAMSAGDLLAFQGVVLIDRDGPFYEIHPSDLWFYSLLGVS
jgi:hypothetical protein